MVLSTSQRIADKWVTIRNKRDRLLFATDWWGVSDLTMNSDRTAYRQALRDIPATYSSDPDTVRWPAKPA